MPDIPIRSGVDFTLRIQEQSGSVLPGPNNTTMPTTSVVLGPDDRDKADNPIFIDVADARVEISNLPLTNWYPGQRFRIRVEPIDSGLC